MRLVELLDGLIPQLEGDPSYGHFQLDGQLAVVDDYLEVRPDQADRIEALNREGRISLGPWYTLPDEFLVSGETLVRDLQLGMRRGMDFGGTMACRLPARHVRPRRPDAPDPGRVRASPTPWCGAASHAAIDAEAFSWEAPDGTAVRAEYLPQGYGNGAQVPDSWQGTDRRGRWRLPQDAMAPLVGDDVLWMNGDRPPGARFPYLARVVAEANEASATTATSRSSLAEYLADAPSDRWVCPPGRASCGRGPAGPTCSWEWPRARVDVKQAAARAERLAGAGGRAAGSLLAGPPRPGPARSGPGLART